MNNYSKILLRPETIIQIIKKKKIKERAIIKIGEKIVPLIKEHKTTLASVYMEIVPLIMCGSKNCDR